MDRAENRAVIFQDTTTVRKGKHPLKIIPRLFFGNCLPINVKIHQNILLPGNQNAFYAKLTLSCKGRNLSGAYLICSALDLQGKMLARDTISLLGSNDWAEYSCTLPLKGSAMLNVQIKVAGSKDGYSQELLLDNLDVRLDNCPLDMFTMRDSYGSQDSLVESPVSLSFENRNNYSQIKLLDESKVLALGETFHGSATITRVATEIMKYQVQQNGCKLILLERPITQFLSLNRYVHGDESVCLDSLFFSDKFPIGEELLEFMHWLKDYNKTVERKVSLYGIDLELRSKDDIYWLCEYLLTLTKNKGIHKVDSLCWQLIQMHGAVDLVSKAQRIPELRTILDDKEYNILIYILGRLKDRFEKTDITPSNIILLRDSLMNSFANFLIDELVDLSKERVVIYTHLWHSAFSRDPVYLNKMLGTYMRQKYGADYTCIGLTVGNGSFLTIDSNRYVVKLLNSPVPNSLEYVMGEFGFDYCYAPVRHDSYSACMIRGFGSAVNNNIYVNFSSLPSYMDGVIYIKQSKPLLYPKELLNKQIEDRYLQRFWKNNGRIKNH